MAGLIDSANAIVQERLDQPDEDDEYEVVLTRTETFYVRARSPDAALSRVIAGAAEVNDERLEARVQAADDPQEIV